MSAATKPQRREVRFRTLTDIVHDAERLLPSHHTVGNWSFGQICQHLARGMTGAIDGFDFKAPWLARWFVAPFIKNSLLIKPMRAGFKLPKTATALLPEESVSAEEGLRQLKHAVDRLSHETPTAPHPFLGQMASEEVLQLQLRHSELHMSFVLPGPAPH